MKGMDSFLKKMLSIGAAAVASRNWRYSNRYLVCLTAFVVTFLLVDLMICKNEAYGMTKQKHIVLLGASVGQAWNIEGLPDRVAAAQGYRFEYVGEYAFDKTEALRKILQWKQNRPDAIFIKECAAYFPGDLHQYQELMKGWVKECKKAGVIPIPTTVVPVVSDKNKTLKDQLMDFIKKLLGRPTTATQLAGILQYNDWVRVYAAQEGLTVLDLEAPLRTSQDDRSLRVDLHSGDGLHLNSKAYQILDKTVVPTLDRAFRKK
jgi:lysophospholipase L1-like esterase